MKTALGRLTGIVSIVCFSILFAYGQATTGSVSVKVMDQTGAPIPGATVTLSPKILAAGGSVVGTTDKQGKADFYSVAPGLHFIKAEAPPFYDYADDISVYAQETQNVSITLGVSNGSYVVVIEDKSKPKPDSIVVTEEDKPLPASPTFRSLLDTSKFARNEPFASGISIDGATEPDNTYFIDGQEVTNPLDGRLNRNHVLPWNMIQELGVRSGAETAQYGGSIGGVVNVVTRGGNNGWHGDFGFSFSPKGLNGGTRPFLNRYGAGTGQIEYFQPNKDDSTAYFPHGSIGGPVFKDRLWFFGAYSPQIYSNRRTVDYYNTNAPNRTITESIIFEQTLRDEFAFVRLDAKPASTLSMSGRYLWSPTIQDGGLPAPTEGLSGVPQTGNGLTGASYLATRGGRNNANFVSGDAVWTPNRMFSVGVRGGYNFLNEKLDSYGRSGGTRYLCSTAGTPQNVPGSNCSPGFNTGDNSLNIAAVTERTNLGIDGGIAANGASQRHQIRVGYQYDRVGREVNQGYVDNGYIVLYYNRPISDITFLPATPGNLGSGFLQRFGTVGNEKGSSQSFYAQDSVRIGDRVSINAGVRFEKEDVPNYFLTEKVDFGWGDKISPRFGVSIDPFANGKTRIFGSYFWNYDRLKLNIFEDLGSTVFFRDFFEILPSRGVSFNSYTFANIIGNDPNPRMVGCPLANPVGYSVCRIDFTGLSNLPLPLPPVPLVEPDLNPTKQKTWSIGIEQSIGFATEIRARYIRKELDNVIEDVGFFNQQGSEGYIVANPGLGISCDTSRNANLRCPTAERQYDALNVGVIKRVSSFFFNADYTLSRLKGSYSGLASSDEFGRVAPNGSRSFDLPSSGFTANGVEDKGNLATDRPHVLKAYGGYSYNWNNSRDHVTSVSAFTTVQSGTPITTVYSLYNIDNSILFGRGDLGRTETFSETDLRVGHRFGVGRDNKYQIDIFSDFLNLFDEKNVLGFQSSISATNFTSTTLTNGGCTTCTDQGLVYNTLFNGGGLQQFIQNFLNANTPGNSGIRNDYGLPNRFQAPRSVRFGVNVRF